MAYSLSPSGSPSSKWCFEAVHKSTQKRTSECAGIKKQITKIFIVRDPNSAHEMSGTPLYNKKTTEPVHRTHYKNLHCNKQKGQVAYHIKKTTKSVYLLQRLVYSMQMSRGPHIHHLLSFFFLLLSHMHTSVLKGNLTQTSHPLNPLNKPINSWCGRHKMMMGMGI